MRHGVGRGAGAAWNRAGERGAGACLGQAQVGLPSLPPAACLLSARRLLLLSCISGIIFNGQRSGVLRLVTSSSTFLPPGLLCACRRIPTSVVLLASAVAAGVSLSGKVMSRESSAASLTSLTSLHTSLPAASSPRAEHDGSEEGEAAEEHKKQLEVEAGAHACPLGSEGEHAPLAIKMEHVGREGEDEDEGDYESEEESGGGTLGRDHRCLGRRDCAHALEVLASDRRNRVMMTREQTYSILPLLFKGLMRHGEEVARGALSGRSGFKSQADYHLVKTMSLLVSSTTIQALSRFDLPASDLGIERSSLRLSQSPLQALIRYPRCLCAS